jgi:hypothetical protein
MSRLLGRRLNLRDRRLPFRFRRCFDFRRRRFFYGDGRAAAHVVVGAVGADRQTKAPFDSDGYILIDRAGVRLLFTNAKLG